MGRNFDALAGGSISAAGVLRHAAAQTALRRPTDQAASTPSEPAPSAVAGLLKMALAALPGARGLRPLDAFPGARGDMHRAAGRQCFPGIAGPTRELAGSDSVQPASVVLSLRRCQPAPARSPWQAASVMQCKRPDEHLGLSQPRALAACSCVTAMAGAPRSLALIPYMAIFSRMSRVALQGRRTAVKYAEARQTSTAASAMIDPDRDFSASFSSPAAPERAGSETAIQTGAASRRGSLASATDNQLRPVSLPTNPSAATAVITPGSTTSRSLSTLLGASG